jgi:hypothetical protein
MGEMRNVYKILSKSLKSRDHLEDRGVYGRIYYNGSWGNTVENCGLDSSG